MDQEQRELREIQAQLDLIRKKLSALAHARQAGTYERSTLMEALYGVGEAKSNVDMACTWER
jgi:hypothetical protein